jgi:hypothetical protein
VKAESVREELATEARAIRLLPTLNSVRSQLLEVMNDPSSSFTQLFDIARYDQGFSG